MDPHRPSKVKCFVRIRDKSLEIPSPEIIIPDLDHSGEIRTLSKVYGPVCLCGGKKRGREAGTAVCLLIACLTSQQQASVSQGWICSDNFACCHTETEVADPTFYPTQSQYIDTGPTSPSADPITPGAWQGSHWSADFESLV